MASKLQNTADPRLSQSTCVSILPSPDAPRKWWPAYIHCQLRFTPKGECLLLDQEYTYIHTYILSGPSLNVCSPFLPSLMSFFSVTKEPFRPRQPTTMKASFDYVSLYLQGVARCPRPSLYVFSMLSPKLSDLSSWEKELRTSIVLASAWVWHASVHVPPVLSHKVLRPWSRGKVVSCSQETQGDMAMLVLHRYGKVPKAR